MVKTILQGGPVQRGWIKWAVELRLGKVGRCLAQDLIGLPEFAVFPLQCLDPVTILRRLAGSRTAVTLGLPDPAPQRLRRAADLRRDRIDRFPLRGVVALMIQHQADSPLAA